MKKNYSMPCQSITCHSAFRLPGRDHSDPAQPSVMKYADHTERGGVEFFRLTCERDLEGIVAKLKHGSYGHGWFKIRNPSYSQCEGRRAFNVLSEGPSNPRTSWRL